jgi:hypothetical protein
VLKLLLHIAGFRKGRFKRDDIWPTIEVLDLDAWWGRCVVSDWARHRDRENMIFFPFIFSFSSSHSSSSSSYIYE